MKRVFRWMGVAFGVIVLLTVFGTGSVADENGSKHQEIHDQWINGKPTAEWDITIGIGLDRFRIRVIQVFDNQESAGDFAISAFWSLLLGIGPSQFIANLGKAEGVSTIIYETPDGEPIFVLEKDMVTVDPRRYIEVWRNPDFRKLIEKLGSNELLI